MGFLKKGYISLKGFKFLQDKLSFEIGVGPFTFSVTEFTILGYIYLSIGIKSKKKIPKIGQKKGKGGHRRKRKHTTSQNLNT